MAAPETPYEKIEGELAAAGSLEQLTAVLHTLLRQAAIPYGPVEIVANQAWRDVWFR